MESNISKLKGVILSSLFSLFLLIFIGCKKNEPLINSSISSDDIQSSVVGSVDNSVDSLAIVDYLDCGAISYGGDFGYDENGKIYYQYESYHYSSDGKFVYESIDGGENGMIECGEELVTESSTNQNMQTQKQWVNCEHCHGAGLKLCYKCSGKGEHFCGSCHGTGSKSSTTGPFTCVDCNGRGVASCRECYGKGTRGDCDYCNGRGQVLIEY